MQTYIDRKIEEKILNSLKNYPVTAILELRQWNK